MSRTKALKNVKLMSFDDFFGGRDVEETAAKSASSKVFRDAFIR